MNVVVTVLQRSGYIVYSRIRIIPWMSNLFSFIYFQVSLFTSILHSQLRDDDAIFDWNIRAACHKKIINVSNRGVTPRVLPSIPTDVARALPIAKFRIRENAIALCRWCGCWRGLRFSQGRSAPVYYRAVKFTTRAILNQSVSARPRFAGAAPRCTGNSGEFRSISNMAGRQNYGACNQLLHTAPVMSTLPLGGINIIHILRARPPTAYRVTSITEEEFFLQETPTRACEETRIL